MKVKAKESNRFFIKDEWYDVINIKDVDNSGYPHCLPWEKTTPVPSIRYQLKNHTSKDWTGTSPSSWFHESNFYTIQEIRDNKINQIILNQPEKKFPI